MILSLNEMAALARKAARGAGLSWGMADETGMACQWLERRGLPGAVTLLEALGGDLLVRGAVVARGGGEILWSGQGARLSSLQIGPSIADHADDVASAEVSIQSVAYPLLLVPHAQRLASVLGTGVTVAWSGCTFGLEHDGPGVIRGMDAATPGPVNVLIGTSKAPEFGNRLEDLNRINLDETIRSGLEALAARTYAPATDASRAQGAGDGT